MRARRRPPLPIPAPCIRVHARPAPASPFRSAYGHAARGASRLRAESLFAPAVSESCELERCENTTVDGFNVRIGIDLVHSPAEFAQLIYRRNNVIFIPCKPYPHRLIGVIGAASPPPCET